MYLFSLMLFNLIHLYPSRLNTLLGEGVPLHKLQGKKMLLSALNL